MQVGSSFGPVDIAVSGMRAQTKNLEIISSNVANARTIDAGKGEPYRRLEALFKTDGDGIGGVKLDEIVADMSDFKKVLDPGSPAADEWGYVSTPNVDVPTEMMNLSAATRAYQANVAVLKRYQAMIESTLELLR